MRSGIPLRIVQISHRFPPHPGGIEYHVQKLSLFLASRKHEVIVLTTSSSGEGGESLEDGVTVMRFSAIAEPLRNPISLKLPLVFRGVAEDADVVHMHSPYTFTTLLSFPFSPRERTLITLHGRPYYRGLGSLAAKIHERISLLLLRGAGRFIALTELDASYLRSMGVSPERIRVIPNFIDVMEMDEWSREARPVEKSQEIQLLFVGGFVEAKGLEQLLLDLRRIEHKNVGLWMIGSGPLEGRLRELAEGLNVHFLGRKPRRDLVPYFRGADALILPSKSEGFPTVVLEAAALRRPVILSDIPVHRILFGDVALFYEPGKPKTLEGALRALGSTEVEEKVERARSVVEERYDIRVVGEGIVRLYEELAASLQDRR